jgi:hypothetical protein
VPALADKSEPQGKFLLTYPSPSGNSCPAVDAWRLRRITGFVQAIQTAAARARLLRTKPSDIQAGGAEGTDRFRNGHMAVISVAAWFEIRTVIGTEAYTMNDLRHWRSSTREFEGGKDRGRRNSYILGALALFLLFVIVIALFKYGMP